MSRGPGALKIYGDNKKKNGLFLCHQVAEDEKRGGETKVAERGKKRQKSESCVARRPVFFCSRRLLVFFAVDREVACGYLASNFQLRLIKCTYFNITILQKTGVNREEKL